jgi:hypothetical protein
MAEHWSTVGLTRRRQEMRAFGEACIPKPGRFKEMLEPIHADGQTPPGPLAAKQFSGKFVLRLEPGLHRRVSAKALTAGESLNVYCTKTLMKA